MKKKSLTKKKNKPLVSVIMNCRNGEKYLYKSIKSIKSQSYTNWELIFFNNKSQDRSREILKSIKDKRIKYYESSKSLNLYHARNLAIAKAKGKYISFLDTDDWWLKSKLKKQVDCIESQPGVNLVFSNLFIYSQKNKNKYLYFKNKISNYNMTQNLLDDYKLGILTVLMNKKIFKKKKFNKKYNIIGDLDFFLNLSLNEKFYCMNEPLAYYREHANNFSKKISLYNKEFNNWSKENFRKFEKKNFSLKNFKFFYFKLKLKNLIRWGV